MRILTVLLVLFTSQLSAQFNTIDGKTFRRLSEFSMPTKNFGVDTVKSISITDTSRASGLLLLSKDTTAMYVDDDTMHMFTTAKAWKFTPKILSDTVNINYLLTNCPKPNRNELLIVTPNAQATTTACDTISYLYVDTISYTYNDKYNIYTALLSQDATDAPTAIVLENTIGTVTYGYVSAGNYTINCTNCFTVDKTIGFGGNAEFGNNGMAELVNVSWVNASQLRLEQTSNNVLVKGSIEIRVYK
jgi:hypothetical protein